MLKRVPVFAISTSEHGLEKGIRIFNGKAYDLIKNGEVLFYSQSVNHESHFIVEGIKLDGRELKTLPAMSVGSLIVKEVNHDDSIAYDDYLYGKAVEEYIPEITFDQAKKMAEEAALRNLEHFMDSSIIPVLREHFEEAECCWFFFSNNLIEVPSEAWFTRSYRSYAVSKKGDILKIYDYSDEPEILQEYLLIMSTYFKKHGF